MCTILLSVARHHIFWPVDKRSSKKFNWVIVHTTSCIIVYSFLRQQKYYHICLLLTLTLIPSHAMSVKTSWWFKHKVVTLVADKLERLSLWEVCLEWKPNCTKQKQLPSSPYNHNTLTTLRISMKESTNALQNCSNYSESKQVIPSQMFWESSVCFGHKRNLATAFQVAFSMNLS